MICAGCRQAVPLGLRECPACRAPAEFSTQDRKRMDVEIRARVLWGDLPEEIREDWIRKGAPEPDIDEALRTAGLERRQHFRLRGMQDLGIALLLFLAAGAAAWTFHAELHGIRFLRRGRGMALVIVAMTLLPLAGLALAFRGLRRLTVGGDPAESASNLSEID